MIEEVVRTQGRRTEGTVHERAPYYSCRPRFLDHVLAFLASSIMFLSRPPNRGHVPPALPHHVHHVPTSATDSYKACEDLVDSFTHSQQWNIPFIIQPISAPPNNQLALVRSPTNGAIVQARPPRPLLRRQSKTR